MAINRGYSVGQPLTGIFPSPIVTNSNPTAAKKGEIGQIWINTGAGNVFMLAGISAATGSNWVQLTANGAAVFTNLTVTGTSTLNIVNASGAVTIANTGSLVNGGTSAFNALATFNAGLTMSTAGTLQVNGRPVTIASAASNVGIGTTSGTLALSSNTGAISTTSGTGDITTQTTSGNILITSPKNAADAILITSTAGAAATVHINNTAGTTANAINITSVLGGILLNSGTKNVGVTTKAYVSASPAATQAITSTIGSAVFTGFTTAAAASQVFVLTNAAITATSAIFVSASNLGGNDAQMAITRVLPAVGQVSVTLVNDGAAALNGNVTLNYWITDVAPA